LDRICHAMIQHRNTNEPFFKLGTIGFSSEPKDIALCYPYVAGIVNNQIEVYSLYTTGSYDDAHSLQVDYKSRLLSLINFDDGKLICGSSERFYFVTGNSLAYMVPPPLNQQINFLYDQQLYRQAHHLRLLKYDVCNTPSEQVERLLMNMHYDAGFAILMRGDFATAFKYFYAVHDTYAQTCRDIRDILALFRELPPPKHSSNKKQQQQQQVFIDSDFFANWRGVKSTIVSGKLLYNLLKESIINHSITVSYSDDSVSEEGLALDLLNDSLNHLVFFLERLRASEITLRSPYEQATLEYTLIALYIRMMDNSDSIVPYQKIESIITGTNSCSFDSNLKSKFLHLLKTAKCLRHYSLLIKSGAKGDLDQYLHALTSLLQNIKEDRFAAQYDVVDDVVSILCDVSGDDLMSEDVRPSLVWCMTKNPSKSSSIFTVDRAVQPEPAAVIRFLNDFPQNIKLQYLHYLITQKRTTEPKHHTLHALTLIDNIMAVIPPLSTSSMLRVRAGEEFGLLGQYRRNLLNHLCDSEWYDVQEVYDRLLRTDRLYEELIEIYRRRSMHAEALSVFLYNLNDWLGAEEYCDTEYAKQQKKFEEELSARRRTKGQVSVQQSNEIYNSLFTKLVQVSIKRPTNSDGVTLVTSSTKFMNDQIPVELVSLLNRRFKEMDVASIVTILPDETPLATLEHFLTQTLQTNYHQSRVAQLKNKLAQNANIHTRQVQLKAAQRSVSIKSDTVCPVCRNPIGNAVFAVFPDMSCVHYRCLQNAPNSKEKLRNVHPQTNVDFEKDPKQFD